ncbi:hypothetical protein [Streptomyces werraensis]|uniref:hypothetical protein n=1 Tax=Streptomyces werraensis TaxID=68284 RepID=UPI003434B08E
MMMSTVVLVVRQVRAGGLSRGSPRPSKVPAEQPAQGRGELRERPSPARSRI